ncbi:uncharacterized protein LOC131288219 [Anopheles ziemanni]|uniref:uncharacterized protein LOC131258738 n=1 Tax=Anopheles coustani TaxID=139045 RepID=UPI00265B0EF3|nr:uncharacterized protein LOC131258738 [Anopheles coustani]XP_058173319.1 uncharacterized protein LOC131288219 [Anopheles ziemanni]
MDESRQLSIQSSGSDAQEEELNQELLKYYKTSLIIALLKQTDSPISVENRALLSMYKHDGDMPLGLDHIRNVELSYHERLAINKYVEAKIIEQARPFVDRAKKFSGGNLSELAVSPHQEQIRNLELDAEREKLQQTLAQLKIRKLQLMNACAEVRTGPYQRNNVELKHAEARSIQSKTELIQKLIASEVFNCTPHAIKAIRDVSANIDTLLGNGK